MKQFILDYDIDALLPDNAELLLKFIPTEEEVRETQSTDIRNVFYPFYKQLINLSNQHIYSFQ